jgi:hypothetical protein
MSLLVFYFFVILSMDIISSCWSSGIQTVSENFILGLGVATHAMCRS